MAKAVADNAEHINTEKENAAQNRRGRKMADINIHDFVPHFMSRIFHQLHF